MNFTAIHIEGNIISNEILDKIRNDERYAFQSPKDFALEKGQSVRNQIGEIWSDALTMWDLFKQKKDKLEPGDPGTSVTRKFWIIPLLYELGYDLETSRAQEINGQSFAISHHDARRNGFPVMIMGCNDSLDKKPQGARLRMSPHGLMQEYLNHTEHLYGLVTNGLQLRLLRDSNRLAKLAYLEFDLEKMFEEDLFSEFALLYRVIHASRMPLEPEDSENAVFEFYHQQSIDSGSRIREKLRMAVKESMEILANGFLSHPANTVFIQDVTNNLVNAATFYKILLRTVYRVIFLATIEERNLVFEKLEKEHPDYEQLMRLREIYFSFYSFERLRRLALSPVYIDPRKHDLWQSLLTTFRLFEPYHEGEKLQIKPLGGTLFGVDTLQTGNIDLYNLKLDNKNMLRILAGLTAFRDERNQLTRVNYRDLDVEELGSIYEALLELHPYFQTTSATPAFAFTEGSERKSTGSYYTRHDLVAQLIKTPLIPAMEDRLNKAGVSRIEKEKAILSLKVCDLAVGSGHFVLAAARTLGFELAKIRSGEENPGNEYLLPAIRDVISSCIYAVDKNPAAVELCQLSLWLVGHNSGKPLSFLEHRIRCGDSLAGVDSLDRLKNGIPDGAFNPVSSDHNPTASYYKKLNRDFLKKKQFGLFSALEPIGKLQEQFAGKYRELGNLKEETLEEVQTKRRSFDGLQHDPQWIKYKAVCDLYTWAFFQPYQPGQPEHLTVTSETLFNKLYYNATTNARLEGKATAMALKHTFFHLPLEFPDVAESGGFDLVLGNPPWERIKLQEKEFFAARDEKIANAANKAAREKLIRQLKDTDPELYSAYEEALQYSEASAKFIRESERFPLTCGGDINTYSIFSELAISHTRSNGRSGIIVPTGIATDDTNKHFFAHLVENNRLVSLFDFENKKALFPNVHRSYKFCLLTASGGSLPASFEARFGFFLQDVLDINDKRRVFSLTSNDFLNINPNTKTCPIFRTRQDAELTKHIYSYVPVLVNEAKEQNPWGISFMRMFDMSNDSHLFKTEPELTQMGFTLMGNRFVKGDEMWLPLYEGRNCWIYDHKLTTFQNDYINYSARDSDSKILTQYFVPFETVKNRNFQKFFFGIRRVTNNTNERMIVGSYVPFSGVTYGLYIFNNSFDLKKKVSLNGVFNSLIFDYFARNATSQPSITYSVIYQLPVLFNIFIDENAILKISELVYSSWDLKGFIDELWNESSWDMRKVILNQWFKNQKATGGYAWQIPSWHTAYPEIHWHSPMETEGWNEEDILNYNQGCPLPPFKWNEERRARLKAELDAYFALLYGLERKQLRYILDPADLTETELKNILDPAEEITDPLDEDAYLRRVEQSSFPGETFRVLKEKEIRTFGHYRTRRLVLEAYNRLRPTWDMESHLVKLKEEWEKCQIDLSKKPAGQPAPKPKKSKTSPEPAVNPAQTVMFEEPVLPPQPAKTISTESKVTIKKEDGATFKYHITPSAVKGQLTGDYRQITPASPLAQAMLGKKEGDGFEFGGMGYTIMLI